MDLYYVTVETDESAMTPSGSTTITVGEWLVWQMGKRRISNTNLRERLLATGYRCSRPFIANMRTNQSKIPLGLIQTLLDCLDMTAKEREHWGLQLLHAYLPDSVRDCLRDPLAEKKQRVLAMMKSRMD